MLINIAILNLKKNFSFYKLYIISLTIIMSIYVTFQSFEHDTIMLDKISSDGRVESMSNTVNVFFIAFVIFFMIYFNSFFLKKRSSELGIYSLLGFSKKRINVLLIYESMLITIFSFILSIFLGSILYFLINKCLIIILEIKNLKTNSIINTIAIQNSFTIIFFMTISIIISNIYQIRKLTLINLVNYNQRKEKLIKNRPIVSLIGFLLLIIGYSTSLNIIKGKESIWSKIGYMPVTFFVLCSTVLGSIVIVKYSIPIILSKLRKNKKIMYTPINNVILPRFVYRMNSKSKILITVTLLISTTLSILSCLVLSLYFPIKATERINPSAIEFTLNNKQIINEINKIKDLYKAKLNETEILQVKTNNNKNIPYEYKKKTNHSFDVISYSSFKNLLENEGIKFKFKSLKSGEGIFINYYPNDKSLNQRYELKLKNNLKPIIINIINNTIKNPISFQNSIATLVVSNNDFNKIKSDNSISNKIIFSLNGKNLRNNKSFYNDTYKILQNKDKGFTSSYARNFMIKQENGSTFLLLSFITILFFITTGNILYFTNLIETLNIKDEYLILNKIGYNFKIIKKIIKKEVILIYTIPLIIGTLNGFFALICYKYMLIDNLLGSFNVLKIPLMYTTLIFSIIYITFYFITIYKCNEIIDKYVKKENIC